MSDGWAGEGPQPLIDLHFPATRAAVRETLIAVDAALAAARIGSDTRARAQIALAEACNNIVEHAYTAAAPPRRAAITLEVCADPRGLQVTLRDRGARMPGGAPPGPDWPDIDPDDPLGLPEGGFGWPLLRAMTAGLSLSRRGDQNILRFRLPMTENTVKQGGNAM